MKKTVKSMILSLAFPSFIFLSYLIIALTTGGVLVVVYNGGIGGSFNFFLTQYCVLAGMLLGGILPIILTIKLKIDTCAYASRRLFFDICGPIVLLVLYYLNNAVSSKSMFIPIVAPIIYIAAYSVFFYIKTKSFKKFIIILLSDPILHFIILVLAAYWDYQRQIYSHI